jgi:hypothetical protein
MGFDQKGAPVFCVTVGNSGEWHVSEEGFEKPLASFQSRDEAEEYARDIARTKEGSTVRLPESQDDASQSSTGGRPRQQSAGNRI